MDAATPKMGRRWTEEAAPPRLRGSVEPGAIPPRRWMPFIVGVVVALGALGVVVFSTNLRLLGSTAETVVSTFDQGFMALVASATCAWIARRSAGKIRLAWSLIAAFALTTFGASVGGLLGYKLFANGSVPFPSVADGFYMVGQGLLIGGIVVFPASASRTNTRSRVVIDGAVIAVSLLYVAWTLGLGGLYHSAGVSPATQVLGLGYPVSDIVAVTILLLTIRQAARARTGRMTILLAGVSAKLVADSIFMVVAVHTGRQPKTEVGDLVWIAGFALIALAALWPVRPVSVDTKEGPTTIWQMLMPWLGMVAVMATSLGLELAGKPIDPIVIYPSVALVVLLMASQLISYKDSLGFLNRSREAEAALGERTHLLNQVVAHAPLGVARIGRDWRFIDANPRLSSLLHAPMKILVGAHISEFISTASNEALEARYAALISGEVDTTEVEGEARRADGSTAWLHWSSTAVRKADGSLDYLLAMAEDISARHEAEETAMSNLAGLERLNTLKSEFVSMVSHEFRTALVGIQGFSELIRDEELERAETKELAGDINNEAMRLNRMIGEMLDLDRMEAGKIRLEVKPINMNMLLSSAVERAQMATQTHEFVVDLDLASPLVSADSDRIIQVISNLLSNAIKYSPGGGKIRVGSKVAEGCVAVSVQDQGVGIPPEFINRLFGRYERFESNSSGKVVGTGLGLAISRQIVELHGGKIWAESTMGSGSTFFFTTPLATAVSNERLEPAAVRAA